MQVNRIQSVNNYSVNRVNRNQNQARKNDVSFRALVVQTAKDSFAPQMQKGVSDFMNYMQGLVNKAINKDGKAKQYLEQLIGESAAQGLIANKVAYTEKTDNLITKLLPMSGLGTRGAKLRDKVTDTLGLPKAPKPNLPLNAEIGDGLRITTANNVLLDMMRAGILSPFENIKWINTLKSDGDATVIVEALKRNMINKNIPAQFLYTDGLYEKGHQDFVKLLDAYKQLGADSNVKVISSAAVEEKANAAEKLGTFIKRKDGSWAVLEKPSKKTLDELIPSRTTVPINTGKTLFTPAGLKDIESRIPAGGVDAPNNTLIKMDKGEQKWHVTEGILKPASEDGTLRVIERDGAYIDTGSGAEITDTLVKIATGDLKEVFPKPITEQIRQNTRVAPDGLSASLKYGDKSVDLPTTFGEKIEKLKQQIAETLEEARKSAENFIDKIV